MRRIWRWIDERFEFEDTLLPLLRHPIPAALGGRVGWWYVLGASTLVAFVVQVVTGVALAMTYVPSTEHAYDSLRFISDGAPLGGLLRGIHFFGASAMLVLIVAHMFRVFLMGAYKFPREANWLTGSLLFLATLLMGFTGQTLRWDQDAFWSVVVGAEQAARTPVVGPLVTQLFVAGPTVGAATLTRFYATHVFIIPGAIFLAISLHLYLLVKRGISEPPMAGRPVDRTTYRAAYRALIDRGIPYFPYAAWRDAVAGLAVVGAALVLAVAVGAPRLGRPPDPTLIVADPRPDWWLVGYFAILALMPSGADALLIIGIPLAVFGFLFALPFLRPAGERHPSRRPLAVLGASAVFVIYAVLLAAGAQAPWVPLRTDEAALPPAVTAGLTGAARAGADRFIDRGCWSCHMVAGSGGRRGPDLSGVADRLTEQQLVARIANGGGGMPAYARSLSADDLASLTAFLLTRR